VEVSLVEPEPNNPDEREIRAARNQAQFRAINEQIKSMNEAYAEFAGSFAIACECANQRCIEMLQLSPEEYEAVRAEPRHFAVLPGHVYPDVEDVVRESNGYVVVEKIARAADVAEILNPRGSEWRITAAAAVTANPADADQVRWLETLAAACERVLARDDADPTDWPYHQVRQDVEELLARVRAELEGER
jgi:hypothetical protein